MICTYPQGAEKPAIPIPYCEEVMTGFEYALAGLMLQNGLTEACEKMVFAVRDRYDGEKRNPWNEIECGSNYARSMASFALMPIYSGMTFDLTQGYLGFAPVTGLGTYLWSVSDTWGTVTVEKSAVTLSVYGKPLTLEVFGIKGTVKSLSADGQAIPFTEGEGKVSFAPTEIRETLELVLV